MGINRDAFSAWWDGLSDTRRTEAKDAIQHTELALPAWIVDDVKRNVTYVHWAEWVGDPDSTTWRPSSEFRTLIATAQG